MDIRTFLGRLAGVRQCASGWIVRCPAHDDDNDRHKRFIIQLAFHL
jgi:hypothetical protein